MENNNTLSQTEIAEVNSLSNSALLTALGPEKSAQLLSFASHETHPAGTVLQQAGNPQKSAIIIEEGKAEKTGKDGRKYTLKAGETSGLLHFYNEDVASSTVVATDEVKILRIDSAKFRQLCETDAAFNSSFIHFLSRQVRQRSNVLSTIAFQMGHTEGIRIGFFDAKAYMKEAFASLNKQAGYGFEFMWVSDYLTEKTSYLAAGCHVVCAFVNDVLNEKVITHLNELGVKMIAMRCAGFDNVDLPTAERLGISVTRVPAYSPYAVAEFAAALLLEVNRKIHKSWSRITQFNFTLSGLVGFDLHGKTAGVFGTGKIGVCMINILRGFGCKVICYDVYRSAEVSAMQGVAYVDTLDELWAQSDIISLHAPLLPSTKHTINKESIEKMKQGVVIINTSRGGLIDSAALLDGLTSGKIGAAGLDVYEGEKGIFFEDKSGEVMTDSVLTRLISCHNVVVTSHQAFLTHEALCGIATSTLDSIKEFQSGKRGKELTNFVQAGK